MSDLQYNKGEYGQTIQYTLNEDVSTATSVELICERGDVSKSLTGSVAVDGVTTSFVVTEGFFSVPGVWFAKVKATFSTRVSEEKEPIKRITIFP